MKMKNLTNQRFGRLIALELSGKKIKRSYVWKCQCDCGNIVEIKSDYLLNGDTKSCGCLKRELSIQRLNLVRLGRKHSEETKRKIGKANKKHGDAHPKTRLYGIWRAMKRRCYNLQDKRFHRYGGRGIKICPEWLNDYPVFKKWALANNYKPGLSIDRIDNDGDYCPNNCQWITMRENARKNYV